MNRYLSFCHYFEKETGPFVSLSDLSDEEARKIIYAPWWKPTYVEVQVWSDVPINRYKQYYNANL